MSLLVILQLGRHFSCWLAASASRCSAVSCKAGSATCRKHASGNHVWLSGMQAQAVEVLGLSSLSAADRRFSSSAAGT